MSRSNPNENGASNPAKRWFEWNGEKGVIRYYDKEAKERKEVGNDFTFLLLDQLASVRGWHDATDSGIYSNEVKDTRQDVLVVKAYKGGTIAEGLYQSIKDRVNAEGGQFVANLYIAWKNGSGLEIGSLRLKGAALRSWMEFCKEHRNDLYTKAIRIKGSESGKKGRIVFHTPVLLSQEVSDDTNKAATALDVEFQKFLDGYLKRTKKDQAEQHAEEFDSASDDDNDDPTYGEDGPPGPRWAEPPIEQITDDDIPF